MADFYSGYNDARARQEKSSLADLQALTGAQALLGSMQDREAKAATLQRANAARATLASLPADASSETVLQALRPHLDPTQLAPLLQSDITHRGNRDNTRQIALARIQQANDKLDQDYQLGMARITDANQKRGFDEWYKRSKIALESEARAQGADKSFYETGFRRPPVALPTAPASPSSPVESGNAVVDPEVMRSPELAAAVARINANPGVPVPLPKDASWTTGTLVPNAAPQAQTPIASPPSGPAVPVPAVAAQTSQPADAGNLDARDLRARAQAAFDAQKVPTSMPAPGAATPPPMQMPNFTGSPKEVAKAKNDWLMDMAKANSKANVNLTGGRESVFMNRVIQAGNQATADLENVVKLPLTSSRGFFGGRGQGKGLMEAGKETMANAMTTQEVQEYNVLSTGFQRALAAIEGSGLAPAGSLMHQMDAVIFKEGDTNYTKLMKLAQTRQIVEKGLETTLANPRVAPETRKHVEEIMAKLQRAVPFTAADLLRMRKEQEVDPNITLGDVVGKMQQPSGWDDTKEKRYQELLRKQRGGA